MRRLWMDSKGRCWIHVTADVRGSGDKVVLSKNIGSSSSDFVSLKGGYFFPMYRLLQSVLYVFYFSFEIKHQKKRGFKTLDV